MLQRVPASSSANFSNRRPFAEIGPRGLEHIACRFRPAHGMRMLLTRAGAKTHEEGHPPVDLFSSAMADRRDGRQLRRQGLRHPGECLQFRRQRAHGRSLPTSGRYSVGVVKQCRSLR